MPEVTTRPKVDFEKPVEKQIEEMQPFAANIYLQAFLGFPVNEELHIKAKEIMSANRFNRVDAKEKLKIELQQKRYAQSLVTQFGDENVKKKIRKLLTKDLKNIKLIDKE